MVPGCFQWAYHPLHCWDRSGVWYAHIVFSWLIINHQVLTIVDHDTFCELLLYNSHGKPKESDIPHCMKLTEHVLEHGVQIQAEVTNEVMVCIVISNIQTISNVWSRCPRPYLAHVWWMDLQDNDFISSCYSSLADEGMRPLVWTCGILRAQQ